jgi:hypothetical protein
VPVFVGELVGVSDGVLVGVEVGLGVADDIAVFVGTRTVSIEVGIDSFRGCVSATAVGDGLAHPTIMRLKLSTSNIVTRKIGFIEICTFHSPQSGPRPCLAVNAASAGAQTFPGLVFVSQSLLASFGKE